MVCRERCVRCTAPSGPILAVAAAWGPQGPAVSRPTSLSCCWHVGAQRMFAELAAFSVCSWDADER